MRWIVAAGIALVLALGLCTLKEIVDMREDMASQPPKVVIQKFVGDGVETLRFEGESLDDVLARHREAVIEQRRQEGR